MKVYVLSGIKEYAGRENLSGSALVDVRDVLSDPSCTLHLYVIAASFFAQLEMLPAANIVRFEYAYVAK